MAHGGVAPPGNSVRQLPPAKFVEDGLAQESIVAAGVIIAGGSVRQSVVSPGVSVFGGATVQDSVIMHNSQIGSGAVVRRAILDKNVVVPAGARIGVDPELDRERYHVTDSGITVLGKGQQALV